MMSIELLTLTWEYLYNGFIDLYAFLSFYTHIIKWIAIIPVFLVFFLPTVIIFFLYGCGIYAHLYRWLYTRKYIREKHIIDVNENNTGSTVNDQEKRHHQKEEWEIGAIRHISLFWAAQAWLWHGYEMSGFENVPKEGGALIIYYHGALPIDCYYMAAKCFLDKDRLIHVVGDKFLWKIPGFKLFLRIFNVVPGSIQNGIDLLRQGHILLIAPGGVREAYFSNQNYDLVWGKRVGFAKIALEAGVPIIPMFTQNSREAYRSFSLLKGWTRKLYEATRLPIVLLYGGFPVKLRTFFGKPIYSDEKSTPEQFSKKVQDAVYDLIDQHQTKPGSILQAFKQRL